MKAPLKPLVLPDVPPMPVQVYNPARLAALAATALMDTEPAPDLDNLCELAASAAGTQQALVVLFDARQAFSKAAAPDAQPAQYSPCTPTPARCWPAPPVHGPTAGSTR